MSRRAASALPFLLFVAAWFAGGMRAQHPGAHPAVSVSPDSLSVDAYRVYHGDSGTPADLPEIVAAMDTANVVFLGERHDDAVAHVLQLRLLQRAYARYGNSRPVGLSLEVFARDVQPVLDEYLDSLITTRHFLRSSRPWSNYRQDYHPLVQFARAHGLRVLAANAPRRYVNRVTRLGREALGELPATARRWLPPLPYPEPSSAYRERFRQRMKQAPHQADSSAAPHHGPSLPRLVAAQALWDATMGYSLAEYLMRYPRSLVLHVAGAFHVERGLGTPAMLRHYRPSAAGLTVTMRPAEEVEAWQNEYAGLADFVILTDASQHP